MTYFWLEMDMHDPAALATIRRSSRMRIASCESLFHRRKFGPFFEQKLVDMAIIDVPWNGILEPMKIAQLADIYEINIADVPWKDSLITSLPVIQGGQLLILTSIGWGAEVNEEVLRAHPPKNISASAQ